MLFQIVAIATATADGDVDQLIGALESVESADLFVYQLRDSKGRGMDCLEPFQPKDRDKKEAAFGVYHSRRDGVFSVHLAKSDDLRTWTHLAELDEHASQATIHECEGGALILAYEKDAPNSCWIRLRQYASLEKLIEGKFSREFDVPRSLAPTAEGTPSFELVKANGDDITLRFHFFQKARVDQLATGVLRDFREWKASPSAEVNDALKKIGGLGNLGDRSRFAWSGKTLYLQELQGQRGNWGTWGVCLCDAKGLPLRKLAIKTHRGSKAFSNPAARWIVDKQNKRKLAVTLFIHSKGSDRSEAGQLLYVVDP